MTKQTEKCLDAYDAHDWTKLAKFEVPGHLTAQLLNPILTSAFKYSNCHIHTITIHCHCLNTNLLSTQLVVSNISHTHTHTQTDTHMRAHTDTHTHTHTHIPMNKALFLQVRHCRCYLLCHIHQCHCVQVASLWAPNVVEKITLGHVLCDNEERLLHGTHTQQLDQVWVSHFLHHSSLFQKLVGICCLFLWRWDSVGWREFAGVSHSSQVGNRPGKLPVTRTANSHKQLSHTVSQKAHCYSSTRGQM